MTEMRTMNDVMRADITVEEALQEELDNKRLRRLRLYVDAVKNAPFVRIMRWVTEHCPECQQHIVYENESEFDPTEVLTGRVWEIDGHTMLGRDVIIGCEGYWVINPVSLGFNELKNDSWSDWTENPDWV